MKFRDKTLDAQGIQYNGAGDIPGVISFVGLPVTIGIDFTLTIGVGLPVTIGIDFTLTNGAVEVKIGDWIMKGADGATATCTHNAFVERFEPVADPSVGV